MIAKDIMTRAVRMIGPGDDVRDAARLMAESGVSALPVVDDAQRILGMVSEGDLLHRSELRTTKRRSWWLQFLPRRTRSRLSTLRRTQSRFGMS